MESFSPDRITFHPPPAFDPMFEAVEQSLRRPLSHRRQWGAISSTLIAAITFGVVPLLVWPRRLSQIISSQRLQLDQLAEWLDRRGESRAGELRRRAAALHPAPWLPIIPLALIALIVIRFIPALRGIGADGRDFLAATYGYARFSSKFTQIPELGRRLFLIWTIGFSLAYGFHWWMVQRQAAIVARFVDEFNALLVEHNIAPVPSPDPGLGLSPMWMILGLLGAWFGAIWAIPAALAGASQWRYVCQSAPRSRTQMAWRVVELMNQRRKQKSPNEG